MKKYILATHMHPDYDGLSSIVGFLQNVTRRHKVRLWGKTFSSDDEYVLFFFDKISSSRNWIVNGYKCIDINELELHNGLLLFDTTPDYRRIGIGKDLFNSYLNEGKVFSIDHHPYESVPNRIEHPYPSTSCCLIEEGIIEDILYLGIWSDTFQFRHNVLESLRFLRVLVENGLEEDQVKRYNELAEPKRPLELFFDLREACEIRQRQKGDDLFLWVIIKNRLRHEESFEDIVNYFKHYCDVLMVSDPFDSRVSFRSQNIKYNTVQLAVKIEGDGHYFASGASLTGDAEKKLLGIFRSIGEREYEHVRRSS